MQCNSGLLTYCEIVNSINQSINLHTYESSNLLTQWVSECKSCKWDMNVKEKKKKYMYSLIRVLLCHYLCFSAKRENSIWCLCVMLARFGYLVVPFKYLVLVHYSTVIIFNIVQFFFSLLFSFGGNDSEPWQHFINQTWIFVNESTVNSISRLKIASFQQ